MENIIDKIKNKDFPLFTAIIAAANIIVFLVLECMGSTEDAGFVLAHGGLRYENVVYYKEYYRIFTHFFVHFGAGHLINNMFVFAVLGYYLENVMNRWRFLFVYLFSGVSAGAVSVVWNYYTQGDTVSAGASGAIYGIMGALFVLILVNRGRVNNIGIVQMVIFIILTLCCDYGEQIDTAAHLAGFINGAAVVFIMWIIDKFKVLWSAD